MRFVLTNSHHQSWSWGLPRSCGIKRLGRKRFLAGPVVITEQGMSVPMRATAGAVSGRTFSPVSTNEQPAVASMSTCKCDSLRMRPNGARRKTGQRQVCRSPLTVGKCSQPLFIRQLRREIKPVTRADHTYHCCVDEVRGCASERSRCGAGEGRW